MTVAVVIVSYDSHEDIADLLQALEVQSWPDFSVYFCENAGEAAYGRLLAAISAAGGVLIAKEPRAGISASASGRLASGRIITAHRASGNLGYAGGVNACIRALEPGSWSMVWILNPDAIPERDALSELAVRLADGGGKCGAVGGRIIYAESGKVQSYGGSWRSILARGLNLGRGDMLSDQPDVREIERRMDFVSGACMLVSAAFIERVGLMDDSYFLYCEEVDWCARRGAFKLGFAPQAIIRHSHGKTIGSHQDRRLRSRLSVYLDERNKLLFTRRFYPAIFPIVAVTTFLLNAQYLASGAWVNYGHAISGWWAGVRGLTGRPPWLIG